MLQHKRIHARLQLEIIDIKEEIALLAEELQRDQDPSKMGKIQSQIGVSRIVWEGRRRMPDYWKDNRRALAQDHLTYKVTPADTGRI